tara:strand:+ start:3670 stop:3984 length:315 start_codon:yes stop_codon:yes gene_type:complete
MTDERFFALARLYGFPADKALREFAACVEHETHAPALLKALQRLTHPMADDDDVRHALAVIRAATGQPVADEDEGPEPPYAGYESEAQLRRMAEVRALRAKGQA